MSIKVMTHVWEHSKQKGTALLLLLALSDSADDNGQCYPGIARLSRKTRMGERNVQKLLTRLVTSNELKIDYNQGIHTATGYTNLYIVVTPTTGERQYTRQNKGVNNRTPLKSIRGEQSDTPGVNASAPKSSVEPLDKRESLDSDTAAQVSLSREKKTTPANVMNPLKDAIVVAMGWEWASMTGTERGTVQKAAKLFAEAGATPEQVIGCKVECDKRGWTNYSPMALTKVLSDVRKQKVPPASQKRPAPVENEDVDLYERAFGVKLKALPVAAPLPPPDDDIPF